MAGGRADDVDGEDTTGDNRVDVAAPDAWLGKEMLAAYALYAARQRWERSI